jgi:LysR family transcriptional regulator for bpeEF and oprC
MAKPSGHKVNGFASELIKQRCFVQTVRTGGISSAARLLSLTPSAVSKNIMRLEAELGAQLLARDNRMTVVTERGMLAFDAWSELLNRLDQIQQELTEADDVSGQIGLSIPSGVMPWLMPMLSAYRTAFPKVQLRLNISDANSDLVRDRNDVALRLGRMKDSSERAVSLGNTPLVVCASPVYLSRTTLPKTPDDLASQEGLFFKLPESGRARPILLPDECEAWRMVATVDNGHALVQAAVSGFGLIQAPLMLVEDEIVAGRLIELLPDYRPPPLEVNLVFQGTRWLPAQTRAFIDMAKDWKDSLPTRAAASLNLGP